MAALIEVNVTSVTCTVSGYQPSFSLSWVSSNTQAGALYQIQLYTGTAQSPMQTPVGSPTTANANLSGNWAYAKQVPGGQGLTQYAPYWLAVQAVDSKGAVLGPPSDPVLAVFIAVPLVAVATDDRQVTLQWSRTATQDYQVDGFMAQINDANSALWQTATLPYPGLYTTASGNPAQTASFGLDFPLELAAQPLTLSFFPYAQTAKAGQISNTVAFSQGPVTNQNFYTVVPVITSAVNAPANPTQFTLTLPNTFGSSSSAPTLSGSVTAGGVPVTGATLSTPALSGQTVTATLTLPQVPAIVANGAPLIVALRQTDSGSTPIATGPAGLPHVLLTGTPQVVTGSFTAPAQAGGAGQLSLALAYPPGQSAASLSIVDSTPTAVFGPAPVIGTKILVQPTLAANAVFDVVLQGVAGADTGPASVGASFPSSPVTLVSASYDGSIAQATWTAPAGATPAGYRMRVLNGQNAAGSVIVAGLNAAIPAAASASGLSLEVAPFTSPDLYGTGASVPLVTQAPAVQSIVTDAVSGLATVTWGTVAGADGYALQLYLNGAPSGTPIPATGNSHAFTSLLSADGDYAVAVAATASATVAGQTAKVAVTGPYGPLRAVPTQTPVIIESDFDGTDAWAAWQEVGGATGYAVSVRIVGSQAAPVTTASAPAGAASLAFPVTISDTSQAYELVVQTQSGPDMGAPSAPAPLFQPGYYLAPSSTSVAASVYPASLIALPLQPSLSDVAAKSSNATCYLPALADASVTIGTVTGVGPFALAPYSGAGSAQYPFALTIAGGAASEAWTFDSAAIRTQLQADYVQFLKNAESASISPYGIVTIQQAIARMMPQTFAETLYYAYGFNTNPTTGGSVDLRPGLIVRVTANPYQYINEAGSGAADNAFTGGPTLDLDVSSYLSSSDWKLGFDSFFAQLVAAQALTVTQPALDPQSFAEQPIADAADLFFPLFNRSFYRIFVPGALASPWQAGSNLPAANFALAAATSFTNLTTANNLTGNTATLAYFGGRSVIRVCVRISLDGAELVVPVGTTVGNILDRLGMRPASTGARIQGIRLDRAQAPVVLDPEAACTVSQTYRVRFDWNGLALYGYANDSLNLPVLHGDSLTTIAG